MTRVLWRSASACVVGLLAMGHANSRQAQSTDDLDTAAVVGDLGAGLDARLTEFEKEGFWGAVLVVCDNRVVLLKGYGFADHERGIRNAPSTRFEMNSITKLFTGAAVLQLAAAKKIDVKDPVREAPRRVSGGEASRPRSSSLRRTHPAWSLAGPSSRARRVKGFLRLSNERRGRRSRGRSTGTSNAGFSLLAALIEQSQRSQLRRVPPSKHLSGAGCNLFRDEVPRTIPALLTVTSDRRRAAGAAKSLRLGYAWSRWRWSR